MEYVGASSPLDSFMYKILYQFPIHSQLLNRVGKIEGDWDLGLEEMGPQNNINIRSQLLFCQPRIFQYLLLEYGVLTILGYQHLLQLFSVPCAY